MKKEKIAVALLVAICLVSAFAIVIPVTIAKNDFLKEPKLRRSDNPILHLPVDEEKWLPIVPPEPVGRPLDEDVEQDIEILIYDIKTKNIKKILKNFTKSEKTMLKLLGSQGSLPSELVPESVIPPDDRVRITPTTDYPWRTICKLLMYFPTGGWSMGSGFIIDNYHVLTAGHCAYDPVSAEYVTSIEVIPALDGGYGPFYHAWVTEIAVNEYWYEGGLYTDDFAILTLDRNVGAFTGWMGLEYADPSNSIYTGILNIAGYPGDLDDGWNMYFDSDLGAGADEFNHWYYMDTAGGQSGSPVWYYDGTYRYVLSIHAYGADWPLYPNSNMGTRLSEYWFGFINDVREGDTPPIDYANLIDDGQLWSGFEPTTVVPGETSFGVWSDIRNIGTAESGGFQVSYYASTDTEITASDHLIGTVSISSIPSFYYRDSDWSGTFPIDIPDGTYWVGWIIDSTDSVPELLDDGENNNIAFKDTYQLTVESTALITYYTNPDDIGSITFNGSMFTNGQNENYVTGNYTATANAPTGYDFHHWEYDNIGEPGVGVYVPDITANPVTAMVSGDGWLKAVFSALVSFRTDPSGVGSITYSGTDYTDGQSVWEANLPPDYSNTVTITANPTADYEFTRWEWTGELSVDDQSANPATLTVDGTGVLTAVFSSEGGERTEWQFDFGSSSSPVETEYIQVTPSTVYSASIEYGWDSSTELYSRDRGSPDNLNRDFVFSSTDRTFMVDLQSGEYLITVIMGDQSYPHDQIYIYAEGDLKTTMSGKAGEFVQKAFTVSVVDGRLELTFHDDGGSDPNWLVNALLIEEYAAKRFDFGTDLSPVETGYQKITPFTIYSASTGFGWSTSSDLMARDRGAPNKIRQDFIFSPIDAEFKIDLLNDDYLVMVILGDQLFAHDCISVYAEDVLKNTLSVEAGDFVQKSFVISISDGQLNLLFHDDGGSDPNWVVNAILIEKYVVKRFDFGLNDSPVEADYEMVLPSTIYSASTNFGWASVSGLQGRDRSYPDDLRRDFVFSPTDNVFCIDLPNGKYMVNIMLGDHSYKHDLIDVYCEDIITINDLTVDAGYFHELAFLATVSDGQLNIRLHDDGGSDQNWVINTIHVAATFDLMIKFDIGTSLSPVEDGYIRVIPTTGYLPSTSYGWTDISSIWSRDRGAPDDLLRDLIFSNFDSTFNVDLPEGLYQVSLLIGDQNYMHDQINIYAEGNLVVNNLTISSGTFNEAIFSILINDGQLNITFHDEGGSDPYWVLNGLIIDSFVNN